MNEEAVYNIGIVARMTGITENTLRMWERRYHFPTPIRTEGGHRLYSPQQVARVQWVKQRIDEGMQTRNAIQALEQSEAAGQFPNPMPDFHSAAQSLVSGEVVREQAGLAYYASTSLNAWIESGSWEVSAGVNPANTQRAIDLIRSENERFVREPVSAEELENSQANYIGRLPLSLESNAGVAGAILNLERFQLGLDYYLRYPERVQRVTVEAVLEAALHYLDPDKLAIISAGV